MSIFHTAISVKNLQVSKKFYEEIFNLKPHLEGERPNIGIRFVMMKDDKGTSIELIEPTHPIPLTQDLMDFSQNGIKHISFTVDNIEDTLKKAVKMGAEVIWPIQKGVTIKKLAFIKDPNNIPLELAEL